MFQPTGVVGRIYDQLKAEVYSRDLCNQGHDYNHILRMLASREAWWARIAREEQPSVEGLEFELDLAILFHDLNRSNHFCGRRPEDNERRDDFARTLMRQHDIEEATIDEAIETIRGTNEKDRTDEPSLVRLLRDFDKADMGAVGIYRMAAVACDRGYGIYARRESFELNAPTIEGDENLDSFADDIKFCMDWWTNPKFEIHTPAIRRIVRHRFEFMEQFLKQLEREIHEIDLV